MFSGNVFRSAPGPEYESRLAMSGTDGTPTTVRTVAARTLDYWSRSRLPLSGRQRLIPRNALVS